MRGIGRAPVLPDEPYVLGADEERQGAVGRRQVRARRRVHRLERLAAPPELDALGRRLQHGAVEHVPEPHDPRHRLRGGLPEELRARRRLDHPPAIVDDDAVGEPVRLGEVVRHDDRGGAPRRQDLAQLVAQRAPQRGVKRRERLVQQEQRRIDRQRPPERDALPLPARELRRVARLETSEAEALDDLGAPA